MENLTKSIIKKIGNEAYENLSGTKTTCKKCAEIGKEGIMDKCLSVNKSSGKITCHKCGWDTWAKPTKNVPNGHSFNYSSPFIKYINSRKISANTAKKCSVGEKNGFICFDYYDNNNKYIFTKYREVDSKEFRQSRVEADKRVVYNLAGLDKKLDYVVVVEGEFDVLACVEAGITNVVSVSQGAPPPNSKIGNKLKCLENSAETLSKYSKVYVGVDMDINGQALAQFIEGLFGKDKCYTIKWEGKDANDVLLSAGSEGVIKCFEEAKEPEIGGVTRARDVADKIMGVRENGFRKGLSTGVEELDGHFSWYSGWWNLFYGIPNSGKSEWVKYLLINASIKYGWKWAIFSPEHAPATDFYTDIIHCLTGKPIEKHPNQISKSELKTAIEFVDKHFYFIYFNGLETNSINSVKNIVETIKKLKIKNNIKGWCIDPFNQLTAGENVSNGRTDQYLERILGELDRLCKVYDLIGNIVAHPKQIREKDPSGNYKMPTAYDLAGGAMWYNKAYTISCVHRPNNVVERDNTEVHIDIQKIKSHKRVGRPALIQMDYDRGTSWYTGLGEDITTSPLHLYNNSQLPF